MPEKSKVVIQLTKEQQEQIKNATGREIPLLEVEIVFEAALRTLLPSVPPVVVSDPKNPKAL